MSPHPGLIFEPNVDKWEKNDHAIYLKNWLSLNRKGDIRLIVITNEGGEKRTWPTTDR